MRIGFLITVKGATVDPMFVIGETDKTLSALQGSGLVALAHSFWLEFCTKTGRSDGSSEVLVRQAIFDPPDEAGSSTE